MELLEAFADELGEMEKLANMRVMKVLSKLNKAARIAKIKTLPKTLQQQVSHKFLGRDAAKVVRGMDDTAGHGASHVFKVTRNAQALSKGAPAHVRRQSTMGALLHDVGRHPEVTARARVGKKVFKQSPELWHSELGTKYTKNFYKKRAALAKMSGTDPKAVRQAVRVHDTDAWKLYPGTEKAMLKNPTSRNVYLGDKMDALGARGAQRTVGFSEAIGQRPTEVSSFLQGNVAKYENIGKTMVHDPATKRLWGEQVGQYQSHMNHYLATGSLPPEALVRAAYKPPVNYTRVYPRSQVVQMAKTSAVNPFVALLSGASRAKNKTPWFRWMKTLAAKSKNPESKISSAVASLPPGEGEKIIRELGDHMSYIFK